jgi:hypothetical protein
MAVLTDTWRRRYTAQPAVRIPPSGRRNERQTACRTGGRGTMWRIRRPPHPAQYECNNLNNNTSKKLCWVHIGKTGGTYLSKALRKLSNNVGLDMDFVSHKRTLRAILSGKSEYCVVFSVRDPLQIYVSGFYSRQRKGAPRYNVEWSEEEAEAFGRFSTANELAEALSSEDKERREAALKAMGSIGHVNRNLKGYLNGRAFLEKHKDSIFFIFKQSELDSDLKTFYQLFGKTVPSNITEDEDLKHKNPDDIDRSISELGSKNLREYYEKDILIYRKCLNMRREILKKIKSDSDAYASKIARVD